MFNGQNPLFRLGHFTWCDVNGNQRVCSIVFLVGGWALPLWKIWVRLLGWWNSLPNWMEFNHKFMHKKTPTSNITIFITMNTSLWIHHHPIINIIQTVFCHEKTGWILMFHLSRAGPWVPSAFRCSKRSSEIRPGPEVLPLSSSASWPMRTVKLSGITMIYCHVKR